MTEINVGKIMMIKYTKFGEYDSRRLENTMEFVGKIMIIIDIIIHDDYKIQGNARVRSNLFLTLNSACGSSTCGIVIYVQ